MIVEATPSVLRNLARRGEHGGEGNPHQVAVLAEVGEQRRERRLQLRADAGVAFRRRAI